MPESTRIFRWWAMVGCERLRCLTISEAFLSPCFLIKNNIACRLGSQTALKNPTILSCEHEYFMLNYYHYLCNRSISTGVLSVTSVGYAG